MTNTADYRRWARPMILETIRNVSALSDAEHCALQVFADHAYKLALSREFDWVTRAYGQRCAAALSRAERVLRGVEV